MSSAANHLDSSFKPVREPAATAMEYESGEVASGENKRLDQFVGHTLEKKLPDAFDESLEAFQLTSGSLLPPFKTVRMQNEPLLEGFAIKSANKTYTQSQTIVVTKEQLNAQVIAG